jgi:hypothetical protein
MTGLRLAPPPKALPLGRRSAAMNHRTTLASLLGFALAVAAGACTKKDTKSPDGKAACTEEAKVCPDGSSVARTGPNCEFAECPAAADDKTDAEATPDAPAEGGEPAEG